MAKKGHSRKRPRKTDADQLIGKALSAWRDTWQDTLSRLEADPEFNYLEDPKLSTAIRDGLQATSKSYHYVLPTQLIAKHVDGSLDARCIQARRGGQGAFDARSVAHEVIVPFDAANQNVLGGAPSPYINNPLRVSEVSLDPKVRAQQKDKAGWDALCAVLDAVGAQNNSEYTRRVLGQVQVEIARLLERVKVTYPVPRRIAGEATVQLLKRFLEARSGGDRSQAIATALFRVMGARFGLFADVRRFSTNAPDATRSDC